MNTATIAAPRTTPTGIPFIDCEACGVFHPETREHCATCSSPSLFLNHSLHCLRCAAGS